MNSKTPPTHHTASTISPTASRSTSSINYIASRPHTVTTPHSRIIRKITLYDTTLPSFPEAFAARDVTETDWRTFITFLVGREKEPSKAEDRRIRLVLAEWNDEFFEPRGLKVELEKKKEEGKGFKIGGATVGVSWNEASGYGIKMGPVLFGVKPGSSEKRDKESRSNGSRDGKDSMSDRSSDIKKPPVPPKRESMAKEL